MGRWLLFTDRQEHRRFRGLMGRFFTPRAVERVRPLVIADVEKLLGFPTIGRIAGPLQWRSEPAAIRALRALPVELSTK